MIGRMEKLPTIFAAAVALGILESAIVFRSDSLLVSPIIFVVLLVALGLQHRDRLSRFVEASSWRTAAEVRPVPRELAHLPEVRWGRRIVALRPAALRGGRARRVRRRQREPGRGRPHLRHRRRVPRGPHRVGRTGQPRAGGLHGPGRGRRWRGDRELGLGPLPRPARGRSGRRSVVVDHRHPGAARAWAPARRGHPRLLAGRVDLGDQPRLPGLAARGPCAPDAVVRPHRRRDRDRATTTCAWRSS